MLGLLQQRSQSLHQGLAEACNIYGYLKRTHASACSIALRVRSCTNVASTAEERRHLTAASSSGRQAVSMHEGGARVLWSRLFVKRTLIWCLEVEG